MGRKNETGNTTSLVDQYRKQLGEYSNNKNNRLSYLRPRSTREESC